MNKEFTGARYFLNIPAEVAHDPNIKRDKSILLFGEIYSMLNVTGAFYMSNKEMAKRLRCKTVKPVKEALNELESLGYIKRKIIKDEKTGAIIGRKITSTWMPKMTEVSKGGLREEPNPSYDDNHPLVTTRTEGRVSEEPQIEHINRTVNRTINYSSAKKEEDPARESIYNQFFKLARMNDDWKATATSPTLDQIKQLRSLLYQCKHKTLQDILLKFSDQMKADIPQQPFVYLIKMLRDGLKGEKEWEKQQ
ncbi:helix-turn-helix domain-containing protein [Lactobacillus helveticus]|uniref:helix-turn-helix domain-containing protein n=1 Tax=Lactobacillus helveticus TaxID=1587 RepID=UPI00062AA428|nr:helix-turn-helix domain-containing protein [Lactobacillus helveticus]AKG66633.1 hypothetical protein TU99_04745 [Lactobacillus helveticus]